MATATARRAQPAYPGVGSSSTMTTMSSTTTTAPASTSSVSGIPPYSTPATSVASSSQQITGAYPRTPASTATSTASRPQQRAAGYPNNSSSFPLRTAGESWSLKREGDKQVIIIEDTPPPSASSYTANKVAAPSVAAAGGAGAAKRVKYNGTSTSARSSNAYPDYAANNAQASTSNYVPPASAVGKDAGIVSTSTRKVSNAKRKYNEVVDPAAANDRMYTAKAQLPCDDKDGHYIIRADDELGDSRRYKIIKLLGQGTFGKVVEAWDRDAGTTVAVKVIRAIQKYRDASKVEIKVLNLLRDRDPHNINKCIHLLDCFDHRNHICIVTKLLGSSVFDFLKDNNYFSFPISHIQSFAKQLLTSVSFLHDLRLVHTDLKPENILLVDSGYGSIPIKPTKAAPQVKAKRILKNTSIHLIDFGSATFEEEYHASVVSTRHYRAPEIILGLGWSYPCDVWSIGCILVEFWTGEALFQTHENLEHLAMMEIVFGRAPDTRWGKQAVRSKPEWFHQGTKVNYPTPATSRQSKKYVKAMKPLETVVPPTNIVTSRFLDLLSHLLKWDPADRYTVREALRHPFFSIKIDDEETRQLSQLS